MFSSPILQLQPPCTNWLNPMNLDSNAPSQRRRSFGCRKRKITQTDILTFEKHNPDKPSIKYPPQKRKRLNKNIPLSHKKTNSNYFPPTKKKGNDVNKLVQESKECDLHNQICNHQKKNGKDDIMSLCTKMASFTMNNKGKEIDEWRHNIETAIIKRKKLQENEWVERLNNASPLGVNILLAKLRKEVTVDVVNKVLARANMSLVNSSF